MRHRLVVVSVSVLLWAACGDGATAVPADASASDANDLSSDAAEAAADTSGGGAPDGAETDLDTSSEGDDDASNVAHDTPDMVAPDTTELPDTTPYDAAPDTIDAEPAPLPCPVITVAEGVRVSPPITLHLSSAASSGDPVTVRWTLLSAPEGFVEVIAPQGNAREVTLEAALAGAYTFRLEAFDKLGQSGCAPAEVTVEAVPASAVHLELVWDDGTQDPALALGADLDLHVFHPDAEGLDVDGDGAGDGWFDPLLDCAWHNPAPTWPASESAPDPGPRLLRRDDDGRGPEVIAIAAPTPGLAYVAGFHVYEDGALYIQPTEIRIWIDGVLKNRPSFAVPVRASRLERVFTVEYPSGRLTFPFATDGDMRPASPAK